MNWDQYANDPEFLQLRREFIDSLRGRSISLAECLSDTRRNCLEIQSIAHRIAGSASSYGFPTLSRIAAAIDDWVDLRAPRGELPASGERELGDYARLLGETLDAVLRMPLETASDPAAQLEDPRARALISGAGSTASGARS